MSVKPLPNESPEYRKIRDELLLAEIALKDQVGRVADLRRRLPTDTSIEDSVFEDLSRRTICWFSARTMAPPATVTTGFLSLYLTIA